MFSILLMREIKTKLKLSQYCVKCAPSVKKMSAIHEMNLVIIKPVFYDILGKDQNESLFKQNPSGIGYSHWVVHRQICSHRNLIKHG